MRRDDVRARAEEAPAEVAASITVGQVLRGARETRRLALEQVAAELHMEPAMLSALESDRFEALGAPVFVKGYLKLYGERLGLDTVGLMGLYQDQGGASEVVVMPRRSIDLESASPVNARAAAVGVLVLAAAAAAWWMYAAQDGASSWSGTTQLSAPARDAGSVAAPAVSAPAADTPAALGRVAEQPRSEAVDAAPAPPAAGAGLDGAPSAADTAAEGADGQAAVGQAVDSDVQDSIARDAQAVQASPAASGAEDGESADAAAPVLAAADMAAEAPSHFLRIEMTMDADCWTEVTDARGERLYYGLAQAGEQLRLAGEPPVSFLLGNADAVRLAIGGELYPVPAQGRQGELARFTVGAP